MAALACVSGLTPAALKVALRLLHHFNCKTARCDPGTDILAAATGLSQRTVFRAIGELETRGLVHIKHRRGRSNTNTYVTDFQRIKAFNLTSRSDLSRQKAIRLDNLTSSTQKSDNLSPENLTVVSGEHLKENVKENKIGSAQQALPNTVARPIKIAARGSSPDGKREAGKIDWARWMRCLKTVGIAESTVWTCIEKVESTN